jgi:hypothetical protein
VFRKIFGPKREEVTWPWRKFYHRKCNDLYTSPNVIRGNPITENGMGRACGTCVGERNTRGVLVQKPEGKRPL